MNNIDKYAAQKRYSKNNREKINARAKERFDSLSEEEKKIFREKQRKYVETYRLRNPEKWKAIQKRYRNKKKTVCKTAQEHDIAIFNLMLTCTNQFMNKKLDELFEKENYIEASKNWLAMQKEIYLLQNKITEFLSKENG